MGLYRKWLLCLGLLALAPLASWAAASSCRLVDNQGEFLIYSYENLKLVGVGACGLDANYRLMSDINASASAGDNFDPIGDGTNGVAFKGNFHGGGHSIINLTISRAAENYVGLFSYSTGLIDSVRLENVSVIGKGYVGGLAGKTTGAVKHSFVSGSVTGSGDYVGGLLGSSAAIDTCSSSITVQGGYEVGGLVGISNGAVRASESHGAKVSGIGYVGGLVGYSLDTVVTSYSQIDSVLGHGPYVGGLVGLAGARILHSSSFSRVVKNTGILTGGLAGYACSDVRNSEARGAMVSGHDEVGGLIGSSADTVEASVSWVDSVQGDADYVGGLIGYNQELVIHSQSRGRNVKSSSSFVGGLAGYSFSVDSSFSTANVQGGAYVGGFTGQVGYWAKRSYSTGSVTGSAYVGGFMGYGYDNVNDCYSTGSVTGSTNVGGFAGYLGGYLDQHINRSYSSGRVTGSTNAGGFVGLNSTSLYNNFWNLEASNQVYGDGANITNSGITGLSEANMKRQASFATGDSAWDFTNVWSITEDQSYPFLRGIDNAPFAYGSGKILVSSQGMKSSALVEDDYAGARTAVSKILSYSTNLVLFAGRLHFVTGTSYSTTGSVTYRVGAVVALGDTLWGNVATETLEYGSINLANIVKPYGSAAFSLPASTLEPIYPLTYSSATPAVASASGTLITPLSLGLAVLYANNTTYRFHDAILLSVLPKALTVSGVTVADKIYDGTLYNALTGGTLSGIIPGEESGVALQLGIGYFDTPDVGSGKSVVVIGSTLTGAMAENYTITEPALVGNITPKEIQVIAKPITVNVGAAEQTLEYSVTGLVSYTGLNGNLARESGDAIGTYKITQGSLSVGSNYSIAFTGADYVIQAAVSLLRNPSRNSWNEWTKVREFDLLGRLK